jgi:transcriptional regulator with XRE-family HTH domain
MRTHPCRRPVCTRRSIVAHACLIRHTEVMRIGELLRATRERHGLTQARLARRIGADRSYVSRVERGEVSPTFEWAERALAAMGEELALEVRRSRYDDHDPDAHRIVGAWDPDRRLADFLASAEVLDRLARSSE